MKSKPMVAIVGRPNVGKSTFFNHILRQKIAIVEDTPGVTRDRIYADMEWMDRSFTLIDTGGIEPKSEDELWQQMRRQAELAIETAQVILFFVDGKQGLTPADEDVADMLRRAHKPIILAVNKIDSVAQEDIIYDFYALGIGEPIAVSAANRMGFGDLLDRVIELLPEEDATEEEEKAVHIALVGRPNVGKSSLVNALLADNRVIVSDIPGTTRDAIDMPLEVDGKNYVLIDTAGLRKKSKIADKTIERYSVIRSLAAVRRCDVALIVIDATEGVGEQETRVAGYVQEQGKAAVIIVNKWDALDKETGTLEKFRKQVLEKLHFMDYAPVLFISAKTGQRVQKVLPAVDEVYENTSRRVPTGILNDVIADAVAAHEPPSQNGRRPRFYYATQVATQPPAIVFFVNDPEYVHFSYLRYMENHLRKSFQLEGTPLRMILRKRKKEDNK
ncbi:MAG: ribosome biogenesis GTPase Der [Clostridia bacterium]|nr:ribosome biogenesis GTPase Der [Clostridia bacterium]